jgi:hypothetical protein
MLTNFGIGTLAAYIDSRALECQWSRFDIRYTPGRELVKANVKSKAPL